MTEPKGPFDAAIRAIDRALLKAKITESCQICQLEDGKAVLEAASLVKDKTLAIQWFFQARSDFYFPYVKDQIRALLEALLDGGERIKTKIPLEVVFPGNPEILPEKVTEYVYMPSGDIVVRVEGGDSLWFNKHGIHPKSRLIFKED